LIFTKWYQIFQKRVPLLIPSPAKKEESMPTTGDVVVFVASDLGRKRNWNWKLGIVERQLTKCRFAIRFLSDDGTTQKIAERNTNEISVIVPVNKLPPTHPPSIAGNRMGAALRISAKDSAPVSPIIYPV
jgi:hypothetical protein